MALVELVMPKLGESITEATILKWHKQTGDVIGADETVLEIATDKVDSEVPSTAEGILEEILFQVNDVVPVGAVIAKIRTSIEETGGYANGSGSSNKSSNTNNNNGGYNSGYNSGNNNSGSNGQATHQADFTTRQPEHASHQATHSIDQTGHSSDEPGHVPAESFSNESYDVVPNVNRKHDPVPGNRFYSPLVLNIASSEGVSMSDLENIPGTGNEGRVTKKDILFYVDSKKSGKSASSSINATYQQPEVVRETAPQKPISSPAITSGNTEIIEMDRMRKMISKHMVDSKRISAHVTSFTEADVTNLVQWREKVKKEFEKREGDKITFTPLFIEAIVKCIKKYPWLNSSVDGDNIIIKKDINIGMATALPNGNLIVPVIKNADQLNLIGLSKQVNGLANSARTGKLRPDDTAGGTFTFTNVGTFGSLMGTPIINQPQVAILAVGAIKKRPVVIETAQGDSIAIRHMMYLSMSYDHRIIDGSLGATFLNAVARELENFNPLREI